MSKVAFVSLFEQSARRNATFDHHESELRRLGARLCLVVGISIAGLSTEAPTRVLAGEVDGSGAISGAQAAATFALFVVPMLEVEPAEWTKLFWFVLKGGEDVPPGTHVLIKGLSTGVSLSSGQADAEGGWVVPLAELDELEIKASRGFSGKLNLDAALVDGDGAVLDEHPVELVVKPVAIAEPNVAATGSPPAQEAITTGAMPSRAARLEQVIGPPIDVESAAATRPSKSRPTDGAPPQDAAVAAAPPPQVEPAGVAAPTRTATLATPPQDAAISAAPLAAPTRPEADAAPRQEKIITAAPSPVRPPAPALVVPPTLDAEAAASTPFAVGVGGRPEDLPAGTYLRVKGLPTRVTLSGGQTNGDRSWVVPLWALEDLKLRLPSGIAGVLDLSVALVDNDGAVLAERSVTLRIKPARAAATRAAKADPALRQQAVTLPAGAAPRDQQPGPRTALPDGDAGAAEQCLSAPNHQPSDRGHWYYRIDRTNHRNCWYVRSVRSGDAEQQQFVGDRSAATRAAQADLALRQQAVTLPFGAAPWDQQPGPRTALPDGDASAAEQCLSAPNHQPSDRGHWYYRTDRINHRNCWYVRSVRSGDAEQQQFVGDRSAATRAAKADPALRQQAVMLPAGAAPWDQQPGPRTAPPDGDAGAAEQCLSAPNHQPSDRGHWYYRTDRTNHRNCWYVRSVRSGDAEQQ